MIYAIADLHLDSLGQKPMDIFGANWINHDQKIFNAWKEIVGEDDLVLVPGDISWATKLEEAKDDLILIDRLPGKKIISKGNHDYWWSSLSKLNGLGLESIKFLNNNSFEYGNIRIFGTRAWSPKDSANFDKDDEKIFARELLRLKNSLGSIKKDGNYTICMLHYPPFNQDMSPNEFAEILEKEKIDLCIYGHLHADGHRFAVNGNINGVEYLCVASDYIDFKPVKIYE
ncbi:metallophosphoesterase [Peptoniphilus sp. GNH]|nr:metallophosphoesterase [Peptoniphilus sp. GNH]